jgi:hypothetical protein
MEGGQAMANKAAEKADRMGQAVKRVSVDFMHPALLYTGFVASLPHLRGLTVVPSQPLGVEFGLKLTQYQTRLQAHPSALPRQQALP